MAARPRLEAHPGGVDLDPESREPRESTSPQDSGEEASANPRSESFEVHLDNFSGPFDLLLSLIAKHKLDVTELALAQVTDEFVSYIRAEEHWDLGTASEFLVVAATLLELKAARLLPGGEDGEMEDLELLEARDLLFARLLQYRAFKEVAAEFNARMEREGHARAREVELEPHFAALLPDLVWTLGPAELAVIAARALAPKPELQSVDLSHLHAPAVSVKEQAEVMAHRLETRGQATFRELVHDAESTLVVVVRFLALLELFRAGAVAFDQLEALGELTVRWAAEGQADLEIDDEYAADTEA